MKHFTGLHHIRTNGNKSLNIPEKILHLSIHHKKRKNFSKDSNIQKKNHVAFDNVQ